jgi:hypothetical protein
VIDLEQFGVVTTQVSLSSHAERDVDLLLWPDRERHRDPFHLRICAAAFPGFLPKTTLF